MSKATHNFVPCNENKHHCESILLHIWYVVIHRCLMIDHSGYGLSQCETMLQYDVSHWRSPEPEWSLLMASSRLKVSSVKQRPFCCGRNMLTSRSKPYLNSVSTCSGNDAVNTINAHVTNISEPGDRLSIDVTVPYTYYSHCIGKGLPSPLPWGKGEGNANIHLLPENNSAR